MVARVRNREKYLPFCLMVVLVLLLWFLFGSETPKPTQASTIDLDKIKPLTSPPPSHHATIPPPVNITESKPPSQQQQIDQKKGFHYLFSVDCATHKATKYNYLSFMLFHTFISLYDEDSGHTLTELVSCQNISYRPPWYGKLPSNCHTITVLDYESLDPDLKGRKYTPYNKPLGIKVLLENDWLNKDDNDVIAIIDPDFLFIKPLPRFWLDTLGSSEIIGGAYDIGDWNRNGKWGGDEICPQCKPGVMSSELMRSYKTGVPNILHLRTLKRVIPVWIHATKTIELQHADWQDEQLGYIYAIASLGINSTLRKDLFISDHEHSPRGFYFIHLCQGIRIGNKEIQTWRFYKYEYTVKINVKDGKEEPTYFYPERSEIYHCGEIPPIPEMHDQISRLNGNSKIKGVRLLTHSGNFPAVNSWMYVETNTFDFARADCNLRTVAATSYMYLGNAEVKKDPREYKVNDFYFYVNMLYNLVQLPELVRHILWQVHSLRKEAGFKEYEKGNYALGAQLLLSLGCENYNGLVCYRLAHMYQYGKGLPQDKKKGQELYIKALSLLGDSALELFFLGVIYKEGLSGQTMIDKAVDSYRKSAKMGCPMAQINLGVCYRTGEGVTKDMARACKYFKRAAEQDSALGQCHIGYMYEFGFGVTRDLKEAVRFYKLAATKKHDYAEGRLKEIGPEKVESIVRELNL